ncbi:hypothetical protein D3C71_1940400 [compost metagenome]
MQAIAAPTYQSISVAAILVDQIITAIAMVASAEIAVNRPTISIIPKTISAHTMPIWNHLAKKV